MRYIIILFLIFVMGCSSTTTFYRDEMGKIRKVSSLGQVKTRYEYYPDGKEVIEQDSKSVPWLKIETPLNKIGV